MSDQRDLPSVPVKGFLRQTADYLYRVYGSQLHRFCIVFPNIRAGLFFKQYLTEYIDRPVWSPTFRSFSALTGELSGLSEADQISMLSLLYKIYKEKKKTNESFDEFYFWGEMLLNDFDDIDKNLVDAHDLFRNVTSLKEIDYLFDYLSEEQKNAIRLFWQHFNDGRSGEIKKDFADIWPCLSGIYDAFKTALIAKGIGYEGMIQREAVAAIRQGKDDRFAFDKYIFIGFNALTPCEEYLFKYLQKSERAMFFWDYDDYYLSNRWHEAGLFMRNNIRKFPSEYPINTDSLLNQPKNIEILAVPSDTGQTRVAGLILGEQPEWTGQKTAIVLTDEHLLLPMLSAIPDTVSDLNITMGYPFSYSPVYSLFEKLVNLQRNARMYADGPRFNHRDVTAVMHHPYIQQLEPETANESIHNIVSKNRIYVSYNEISGNSLFSQIFLKCKDIREFIYYLQTIFSDIVRSVTKSTEQGIDTVQDAPNHQSYQLEYLFVLLTSLQRISDIISQESIQMELHSFYRLLRQIFSSLKIPFSGEPLKGLQIMGMLETRALDFDRVIILSMNEGIFPKATIRQSFVPYNLRKGFGLPTSDRSDAVSAYHFYRLIQRASNISLIYNSAATDLHTGEMSRYISQLIYEPEFKTTTRNMIFNIGIEKPKSIIRERDSNIQAILQQYFASDADRRILSPSAINIYLDCSLRFYFQYIEKITQTDQVTDEIDPSAFGKLLHKTMQLLYNPYVNAVIDVQILDQLLKNKQLLNQILLQAFAEDFFHTDRITNNDITGRNIIIKEVLMKYICRILEIDKRYVPFSVLTLEKKLEVRIPVYSDKQNVQLNMGGYIDRLDYMQDSLRIIDYKTGNARRTFSGIADLFDSSKAGNHAVMQTLIYARMVHSDFPHYSKICSGLYITKELFSSEFDFRIKTTRQPPIDNYFDISTDFETYLNTLLAEIFLSEAPFTQTTDEKRCVTCLFANICHKKTTGKNNTHT